MGHTGRNAVVGMLILFCLLNVSSCATIPVVRVTYSLPPGSGEFRGHTIGLHCEDARHRKQVLAPAVQHAFPGFSGNLSLGVMQPSGLVRDIGVFPVVDTVRHALTKRLEAIGFQVMSAASPSEWTIHVAIHSFVLDMVDRRWLAIMSYEAALEKEGRVLATQQIEGQAERFRLVGTREVETVLGELFTDVVNRLDVSRLFKNAERALPAQ